MKNHNYFFISALPVGPYVELEMIRDMIPQIEPLPIAILFTLWANQTFWEETDLFVVTCTT